MTQIVDSNDVFSAGNTWETKDGQRVERISRFYTKEGVEVDPNDVGFGEFGQPIILETDIELEERKLFTLTEPEE